MVDFRKGLTDLDRLAEIDGEDEIEINFRAYVNLAAAFIPDFMRRSRAAIANVSFWPRLYPAHFRSHLLRHEGSDTLLFSKLAPPTQRNAYPGI